MTQLVGEDRVVVRQFLVERFSLSELKTLAFDLGVDYELFPHQTKGEFSRELLAYFQRTESLSCLVTEMVQRRPDEELVALLAELGSCSPRAKVQIVLPGDKLDNREGLLSQLASVLGVAPDQVMLIATAPGSIRLLISLPEEAATRLVDLDPDRLGPNHPVTSIVSFEALPPDTQQAWLETALAGKPAVGFFGLPALSLTPGLLLGLAVALTGMLIGAVAVATPLAAVENKCDRAWSESTIVPVLGEITVELAAGERRRYPIPPGQYTFSYDGAEIVARVPIAGELKPFPATGDINATYNGTPIVRGERQETVRLGARPHIVLCPNGR
ncbi:MAG: hypothetical protein R3300_09195 [Candidatus Promineifilaceae bacterium]|nr:hypothetical protein [Candidatus Promineifilaceae bacterium]